MSRVTTDDLYTILLGTEHSGNTATVYRVSYAVPNSLLGTAQGGNNSGFSFGIVQLDIGVNGFAQNAYTDILTDARTDGIITQTQYDRLIQYRGESRYDLDPALASTYAADRTLLNSTVFTRQDARDIVDTYNAQYLEQSLLGTVQNFLDAMTSAWGEASVFFYTHPDYHTAVAAITSLANRFGSLTQTTLHFEANQPDTLADVRARFNTLLPTTNAEDWQLVRTGGNLFAASDLRYDGVDNTITLTQAVDLLNADSASEVVEFYLRSEIGNAISNVRYTGSTEAAFLVGDFNVSGKFALEGGILLSTGALPGPVNTQSGFGVSLGTAGDVDLNATAVAAFSGAGTTNDAAVIEFTLDVVGSAIDGISFDIIFGSDEFPEYSDSRYVDIAAIYVNGVNVALFNDNPTTPLSIISQNLDSGNFNDNTTNAFGIEWDGFSNTLTVRAGLIEGQNDIKVAIADTGDFILDSGIYINNIALLSDGATGGGVLSVVDGDDGDNTIEVSVNREEVNLFGGIDVVEGTSTTFNNDIITGFDIDDTLLFRDTTFLIGDIRVTLGSAIIDIDTDQDGDFDTQVTLEGNFEGSVFAVDTTGGGTTVTVDFPANLNPIEGGPEADFLVGTEAGDVIRGFAEDDRVEARAGDDTVEGGEGNDALLGMDGDDSVNGDVGDDNIALAAGNDTGYGGDGNDALGGGDGDDLIYGGIGNDVIGGGNGIDLIYGDDGSDNMSGGYQTDRVDGGEGNDTLAGSFGSDTVYGGTGNDSLGGGDARDTIYGGDGNDLAGGGLSDDDIHGEFGRDFLAGGEGNDTLRGGEGHDTLNGGDGDDRLIGNEGRDVFVFNLPLQVGTGFDYIQDFANGLDLLRIIGVAGGSNAARFNALDITDDTQGSNPSTILRYQGNTIYLEGVGITDIDASDFLWA